MFLPEALQFRQFYSSALGRQVQLAVGSAIRRAWPACRDETLAGIGFALPYLGAFADGTTSLVSLMPRDQGAIYWPPGDQNRSLLIDPESLPVADNLVNRAIVIHALEHSHHAASVLKELWRVLVPGGRALLIVPNRRGLWSGAAHTPFGCGQPYTALQLRHRASLVGFTFVDSSSMLYAPPLTWRWLLPLFSALEILGRMFLPGGGGVIMIEIEKQIYASIPEPARAPLMPVLYPSAAPGALPT